MVAGDRVAVIAPAGPVDEERLKFGLDIMREWGLDLVLMPSVLARHEVYPYLAGDDLARAKDFRDAWLDPAYAASSAPAVGTASSGCCRTWTSTS